MTSINEKMGLKPAGARTSTKSKRLVTALRCDHCGCRQVLASAIEQGWVWCGGCGHRWPAPDVDLPIVRGADRRKASGGRQGEPADAEDLFRGETLD